MGRRESSVRWGDGCPTRSEHSGMTYDEMDARQKHSGMTGAQRHSRGGGNPVPFGFSKTQRWIATSLRSSQ